MRTILIAPLLAFVRLGLTQSVENKSPTEQRSIMAQAEQHSGQNVDHSVQSAEDDDDDDALMVHYEPKDNRSWALSEREKRRSQGEEVVLMSELPSLISREPNQSNADYAKRYVDKMKELANRGVAVLNDQCTGDVAPDVFSIGGHDFDVGPQSGVTKKEYREFGEWLGSEEAEEKGYEGVPERFLKFEKRANGRAQNREIHDDSQT